MLRLFTIWRAWITRVTIRRIIYTKFYFMGYTERPKISFAISKNFRDCYDGILWVYIWVKTFLKWDWKTHKSERVLKLPFSYFSIYRGGIKKLALIRSDITNIKIVSLRLCIYLRIFSNFGCLECHHYLSSLPTCYILATNQIKYKPG